MVNAAPIVEDTTAALSKDLGTDASRAAAGAADSAAAKAAAGAAATAAAETAAADAAETAAADASKMTATDAAKYAGVAAAAGLGLYTYINAQQEADKSNGTPRTITNVVAGSGTSLKISYTPAIPILMGDSLRITGTTTKPVFDGVYNPVSVQSVSQVTIDPGFPTSNLAAGGTINVTTSVGAQATNDITTAGKDLGNATTGAGTGFLSGMFNGLGLGNLSDAARKGLLASCIICCVLMIVGAIYMQLR